MISKLTRYFSFNDFHKVFLILSKYLYQNHGEFIIISNYLIRYKVTLSPQLMIWTFNIYKYKNTGHDKIGYVEITSGLRNKIKLFKNDMSYEFKDISEMLNNKESKEYKTFYELFNISLDEMLSVIILELSYRYIEPQLELAECAIDICRKNNLPDSMACMTLTNYFYDERNRYKLGLDKFLKELEERRK